MKWFSSSTYRNGLIKSLRGVGLCKILHVEDLRFNRIETLYYNFWVFCLFI